MFLPQPSRESRGMRVIFKWGFPVAVLGVWSLIMFTRCFALVDTLLHDNRGVSRDSRIPGTLDLRAST
jgi:hypothetical protein